MKIRAATVFDKDGCVAIARRMHAESVWRDMDFCEKKIGSMVDYSTDNGSPYFVAVVEVEHKIVGGMIGFAMPSIFGKDILGTEAGIYIEPEHRSYKTASRLLCMFEDFCKEHGAKRISISNTAGIVDGAYLKFLMRRGYRQSGVYTMKNIGGCHG